MNRLSPDPAHIVHEGLIDAARAGDIALVREILADSPGFARGLDDTPLTAAVKGGSLECVEAILPFCNPDTTDQRGRAPLIQAAARNRADMAAILLAAGASRTKVDRHGHTALGSAACNDSVECVLLLARGIDLDDPSFSSSTTLTCVAIAALSHAPNALAALMALGAHPRLASPGGPTPLAYAAMFGRGKCVEILLSVEHTPEEVQAALKACSDRASMNRMGCESAFIQCEELLRARSEQLALGAAVEEHAPAKARPRPRTGRI